MAVERITGEEWESKVLRSPGRVLVDFYAIWCGPCRSLAPVLERFAAQNRDRVTVYKLDTDEDEEIAARYGVRTIPTLIAFEGGQEKKRAINPRTTAALQELIED